MNILVIDVGTSSVRAAIVDGEARIVTERQIAVLPESPAPGLVEFDARAMATAALEVAAEVLASTPAVHAVGVATQRASTVVWDRATGEPVGPGLGWQDLRTVGDCLVLQAEGLRLAPNQTATKARNLIDAADPDRVRDLCIGTVDSWIVWNLTRGADHLTDITNAGVTGLLRHDGSGWDFDVVDALGLPRTSLPRIVDCAGPLAEATALPGAPPIYGLAGDQQASLIGQGCVDPGQAKITFGTGGMLDVVLGAERPASPTRGPAGTFPIIARRHDDQLVWGREAVMLSAGSNIEWLRDDLGLIENAADSHRVAASVESTDGVVYVPALLGLGTPWWDHGARSALMGLTRGSTGAHVVRAVLEGIAHRGADLVEATEADADLDIPALRVDGGMSDNPTFIQALADATERVVEVSPVREATTLGAALLAGVALGHWGSWSEVADTWSPRARVEPTGALDRDRWREAVARAGHWYPELSGLDF